MPTYTPINRSDYATLGIPDAGIPSRVEIDLTPRLGVSGAVGSSSRQHSRKTG